MSEELPQSELQPATTPPPLPVPARPWGFFATLGWAVLIVIAYSIAEGVAVAAFAITMRASGSSFDLQTDGKLLALSTLVGVPVIVGLCMAVASLRKGCDAKAYLALRWPAGRIVSRWVVISIAFAAISDGFSSALGKPLVPDFMIDSYESAGAWRWLLLVAVIFAAPIAEETFFRGFLFAGIRQSRAGLAGAMILTSAGWAAIHVQYDLYGMISIFALGLLLGIAREKTNSLYLCMFVHAVINLTATIELLVYRQVVTS